jgi:hypothetical protein
MVRRWVLAIDVQIEIAATSQAEAEYRALQVLGTRREEPAVIERQRVRWALEQPGSHNGAS